MTYLVKTFMGFHQALKCQNVKHTPSACSCGLSNPRKELVVAHPVCISLCSHNCFIVLKSCKCCLGSNAIYTLINYLNYIFLLIEVRQLLKSKF